jgi:hypothetical protein
MKWSAKVATTGAIVAGLTGCGHPDNTRMITESAKVIATTDPTKGQLGVTVVHGSPSNPDFTESAGQCIPNQPGTTNWTKLRNVAHEQSEKLCNAIPGASVVEVQLDGPKSDKNVIVSCPDVREGRSR